MKKKPSEQAKWVQNLLALMEAKGLNPRSLSLKAGLNQTAVRDMLEGRTRFPRYDTVQALAAALETTPPHLMGDEGAAEPAPTRAVTAAEAEDNLDLLTEIIARLQEVAAEYRQSLAPADFAAMVTSIYQRVGEIPPEKKKRAAVDPKIHDLLAYESIRHRRARG